MAPVITLIITILINLIPIAKSDNYLVMFPPETGSQTVVIASAATAMLERNHSVTLLAAEDFAENVKKCMHSDKYIMETFKSSVTVERFTALQKKAAGLALQGRNFEYLQVVSTELSVLLNENCEDLFNDQQLIERLEGQKFDLVFLHTGMACAVLLSQHLEVPFVSILTAIPPTMMLRIFGNPVNPSYTPEFVTGFSNRMTFLQRVKNTIFSGIQWMMTGLIYHFYDDLKLKYNIKPEMSTFESVPQAELFFICSHFVLDFPRAYQPNVISVGGLSAVPPRPLPKVSELLIKSLRGSKVNHPKGCSKLR